LEFQAGRSKPWTKVPFTPWALDRQASSTDPSTWGSFDGAIAAYLAGLCDGIGFMLGDGWIGFDIDGCRDPQTGVIDAEALRYCRALNTYSDQSPTGTGLHAIAHGTKPGARCRTGRYELYDHGRYLTMTRQRLVELPATVEERTPEIAVLYRDLFGEGDESPASQELGDAGSDLSDADLLARASESPKFAALWNGDTSGYPSHSEADCALCVMLSFWTRRDAARIDALFRRSQLCRDKWTQRDDYRRRTIAHAIALTDDVFEPDVPFHPLEPDMPSDDVDLDTPAEWI
jgi:primase-polymerase (primpol)-like protein